MPQLQLLLPEPKGKSPQMLKTLLLLPYDATSMGLSLSSGVSEMTVLHDAALRGFLKGFHTCSTYIPPSPSPSLTNEWHHFRSSGHCLSPPSLPALMYGKQGLMVAATTK